MRAYVYNDAFVAHRKGMTVKISNCVKDAYSGVIDNAAIEAVRKDSREFYLNAYHNKRPDGTALNCADLRRSSPSLSFLISTESSSDTDMDIDLSRDVVGPKASSASS